MKPTLFLPAKNGPLEGQVIFSAVLSEVQVVGTKVRRMNTGFIEILGPFDHPRGSRFDAAVVGSDLCIYVVSTPKSHSGTDRKAGGFSRIQVKLPKGL